MNYEDIAQKFKTLVENAKHLVVMQGDNPDGDSLSSSLALEAIFSEAGKKVTMYCAIDVPEYLRYLDGWDRVTKDFPDQYDVAIVVDCGFSSLLQIFYRRYGQNKLLPEKTALLDHHAGNDHDIPAVIDVNDHESASTGQVIFEIVSRSDWKIPTDAANFLSQSIMADTLGLTSEVLFNRPRTFEIMAELTRLGINLSEWQEKRLERMKISPELLNYRGKLLQRVEFFDDNKIALITIPYEEIREFSQDYNPTVVLDDARLVDGVAVTIGLKQYVSQGHLVRITGRIRCNRGYLIAEKLASQFGEGGGHPYAAGFKIEGSELNFDYIKQKVIKAASSLLANL